MSLSIGTVNVSALGSGLASYSGTGMAKAIMDGEIAGLESLYSASDAFWEDLAARSGQNVKLRQYEACAARALELATKLVPYLIANVVVKVTVDGDDYTGTIE